jgi:transketolase
VRNAFATAISALAQDDDRIVLLSGDIGNRMFDKYKASFPQRFYNCGVAEANMLSMAAGLALCGLRPVCYTIAPFITYRCLEQIRVDVCYHKLPVIIVGTGAGLSYASLGTTHHTCEDIGMMRLLPHMTVLAPADPEEVKACLHAACASSDPIYLRIGKKGEPTIHHETPDFQIGRVIPLRAGHGVVIMSAGTLTPVALAAAELLHAKGLSIEVVSSPSIKPIDEDFLRYAFANFDLVITLEEHTTIGGLGGSVAEWLSDHPKPQSRLLRLGAPDEFLCRTCDQKQAREYFKLTPEDICARILHQQQPENQSF